MDQISSHNSLRTNEAYQQHAKFTPKRNLDTQSSTQTGQSEAAQNSDFASMFNDDSLLKLQSNLEAISQMAERSLKQIDS